jgi:hypothetical protein
MKMLVVRQQICNHKGKEEERLSRLPGIAPIQPRTGISKHLILLQVDFFALQGLEKEYEAI